MCVPAVHFGGEPAAEILENGDEALGVWFALIRRIPLRHELVHLRL
jgi:hypothetical protein